MKTLRIIKGFTVLALLVSASIWVGDKVRSQNLQTNRRVEAKRLKLALLGTWEVKNKEQKKNKFLPPSYWKFNHDGTGEEIWEEKGQRKSVPFTYAINDTSADTGVGFFQMEITCDWTYYGGKIIQLVRPDIPMEAQQNRVNSFPIYIEPNQNHIQQNPYGRFVGSSTLRWSRVDLSPLPGEVKQTPLSSEAKRLRLVGKWSVLESAESANNPAFHMYQVFNHDGTGTRIWKTGGASYERSFTYRLTGSSIDSRVEIICDWTFCGNKVVPWDDPCMSNDPTGRVTLYPLYFGLDHNRIYLTPDLSDEGKGKTFWQRASSKIDGGS